MAPTLLCVCLSFADGSTQVYLQLYRWWDLSKGTFSGVPPAKFIIAFDHALEEDMYM